MNFAHRRLHIHRQWVMEQHNQELVNSLVKDYAKIERLAASILEDKQQVKSKHGK